MNRNPLTPTAIVDKNGRQTTVLKRADGGNTSTGKSIIPAPALHVKLATEKREQIEYSIEYGMRGLSATEKEPLMATLHPETMERIYAMTLEHPNTIMWGIDVAADWSVENRSFAPFNSVVKLSAETDNRDSIWHENVLYALMGVRELTKDEDWIDLTDPDDPRVDGARAFINSVIENRNNETITVKKEIQFRQQELTFREPLIGKLIMEYPERADEIVNLYKERGECDKELFESVLRNSAPALNDGIL